MAGSDLALLRSNEIYILTIYQILETEVPAGAGETRRESKWIRHGKAYYFRIAVCLF